ncbi:MAG: inositol monophosphatase [Actinobacteria bacterium]|nr:inositol monophosphatase [Actinomycetota bacterium]
MTDAPDRTHLLDAAVRAAHVGGALIADRFGHAPPAEAKAPGDYVTAVDHASEESVRATLDQAAPGIPFFGEEQGGVRADLGWIVDPLDGTANFMHAFPAVGVSVALVEAGHPVVGVVHAPLLGHTWTAVAGAGAHLDGEPVRVSERLVAEAICGTGFPFKVKDRLATYMSMFEGAFRRFEDLRRPGAASLDLAWVASGVFEGFFELSLGPWDVAAGALLIREAGGVVTDWRGDDAAWLDSGDVLAGPAHIHDALAELAAAALQVE